MASASTTPRFGMWDPCEQPLRSSSVNVDGCWENNCGAGVCRDLPIRQERIPHDACDCDPGYAEAVVGGPHKTCRNDFSFEYEGCQGEDLQGCQRVISLGW